MKQTGLYWFNHDLRLHDNPALLEASLNCDQLICLFCVDEAWFKPTGLNARPMGENRLRFLQQSLRDLSRQLSEKGQSLIIVEGNPVVVISDLIRRFNVDAVYRSHHVGVFEQRQWQHLKMDFPRLKFESVWTHTLFRPKQLPFALADLPNSFTPFRKRVEHLEIDQPLSMPVKLPPPVSVTTAESERNAGLSDSEFEGGETRALSHLTTYFDSEAPLSYKETRNELDGWSFSTKFSPWLANGNVSVRYLLAKLREYEKDRGANESTYWIYFELLWREYFQWVALKLGHKLFSARGVSRNKPSCCFYPERYQKWCHGTTPYPLVNALMKQLNETGYMSNRGRQIVASCLVHELHIDWRFGAAYFEQQLLDYDVASNWGNWQYIAGVGMDPRGGRHFNLDKQTQQFDPDATFIRKWHGDASLGRLDSVDAADWPIMPEDKH